MIKKTITVFTLFAFILFMYSCTTTYEKQRTEVVPKYVPSQNVKITGVQLKSREIVEFSDKYVVEMKANSIRGCLKEDIEIDASQISSISIPIGNIYTIESELGKTYLATLGKDGKYWGNEFVTLNYEDVELVWVERTFEKTTVESGTIIGIAMLAVAATIFLIIIISQSSRPAPRPKPTSPTYEGSSCSFIYSYDGENYVFDAEPYAGAYAQGLQRTEWCALENLKEIDGQYSILLSNELEETQYMDEIKLIAVDHPQGSKVAPDHSGTIHTLANLIAPLSASDTKGRDIRSLVAGTDSALWLSREDERNLDTLREELVIEFPKPAEARKAKLVVNAQTTLWGSEAAKRYIELYGDDVDRYYGDINSRGPAYSSNILMNLREELYGLQIRVQTDSGWKTKGIIRGGNPFISEDVVCPMDLSDVNGETLKIRLTPPSGFWMINSLAVDYTEDQPVALTELAATEATDHARQDVIELFASADNRYHVMPDVGDSVHVVFDAPARTPGKDRTVFLKANGYYEIHLQAEGLPQYDLIERIRNEPGFALLHAHREYLRWRRELAQQAEQR